MQYGYADAVQVKISFACSVCGFNGEWSVGNLEVTFEVKVFFPVSFHLFVFEKFPSFWDKFLLFAFSAKDEPSKSSTGLYLTKNNSSTFNKYPSRILIQKALTKQKQHQDKIPQRKGENFISKKFHTSKYYLIEIHNYAK